jgi:heme exporter protein C
MQIYANPTRFLQIANTVLPWTWVATMLFFSAGLYGAFVTSPPDYQQGETVRIMYVHVPAAWMAMFVYAVIALSSAMAYIFRHPLADAAAKTAAPIGAVFCFLALMTGSIWGKPMWGTWWEWGDARLMSVFILFLLYLGYIAIWQVIEDPHRAADLARIVALVGVLLLPVIKFSVDWWKTLHQPASVFRVGGPRIDESMLWPLLTMALAYTTLYLALHLTSIRTELAVRKQRARRLSEVETF